MKIFNCSFLLFSLLLIFPLPQPSIAQKAKNYTISVSDIDYYLKLNNQEDRLSNYKDDKAALSIKLNQLAHINASRKKYRKKLVKLDILASRVANKMAQEAVQKGFMGHFNPKGETPYHRYAFVGGTAHVSENASSLSSTGNLPSSPHDINSYMQQAHDAFMNERAPNDGHKQNCIHTFHNYVGIGYYLHHGEFRYYEEFLDQYIEFGNFPSVIKANQPFKIPVKTAKGKYVHMVIAYYEKFPSPMSISSINRKMTYDDYTNSVSQKILPWDLPKPNTQGFTELEFKCKKRGLYYIQIYLDNKPFKSGSANTKGKVQASGVVIQIK